MHPPTPAVRHPVSFHGPPYLPEGVSIFFLGRIPIRPSFFSWPLPPFPFLLPSVTLPLNVFLSSPCSGTSVSHLVCPICSSFIWVFTAHGPPLKWSSPLLPSNQSPIHDRFIGLALPAVLPSTPHAIPPRSAPRRVSLTLKSISPCTFHRNMPFFPKTLSNLPCFLQWDFCLLKTTFFHCLAPVDLLSAKIPSSLNNSDVAFFSHDLQKIPVLFLQSLTPLFQVFLSKYT